MNYRRIYGQLIAKADSLNSIKDKKPLGMERHHIQPRCMGGKNLRKNYVYFTPEQHYVAHQLLVKIYPGQAKLVWACMQMMGRRKCSNKKYGWLKRKNGAIQSERMRGANNPMYGKTHTEDVKNLISTLHKGRTPSKEARAKMSAVHKGNQHRKGAIISEEQKAKISAAMKGKKASSETLAKMSASRQRLLKSGWTNPFKGGSMSDVTKKKMREAKLRRVDQSPFSEQELSILLSIHPEGLYNVKPQTLSALLRLRGIKRGPKSCELAVQSINNPKDESKI